LGYSCVLSGILLRHPSRRSPGVPAAAKRGQQRSRKEMMANAHVGGESSTGGEMDELLILLEQKDSDLRRAAELGKMLLDEKEADAEAHEGEKEALWRRIQDMARRVMELEQEAAESRDELSLYLDRSGRQALPAVASTAATEGRMNRRMSIGGGGGSGGDRAEERALRAKNELLERQLVHMKEEAEERQLELAAAQKARFSRRSSLQHSHGGRSYVLNSPAPSSRLGGGERGLSGAFSVVLGPLSPTGSCSPGPVPSATVAAAADGGGGGCST
ncbi:unnamed protein product, partial [Pylaiella littoralis]